jgi:hypothetical protein
MSKFKIEFSLKQHTPLIHFQSEQSGATLRATELKPKFDRFLLEQVEGIPFVKNANGSKSLDYKVKIEPDLSSAETIETLDRRGREQSNPLFFGNMGDGEYKKFKQHRGTFKIEFFSFNSVVLEAIKNNFEAFLANTNFGTRQSKGFGSFYLNTPFNKNLVNHKVYSFTVNANNWEEDIKHFYSFLRAGINTANFRGIYAKAVIFAYAKSKGITWDKKAIKQAYMGNELRSQQNAHPSQDAPLYYSSDNQHIVRDLFGLSSSQSWMSYRAAVDKEHTERDNNKKVDRFKSPITFKPVKEGNSMRVYFWADKSVEKILNKEFIIKVNKRGDLKLNTPEAFSFDEFFEFSFNLDLSKYIDSEYHNNGQYTKLVSIFNEIKESK